MNCGTCAHFRRGQWHVAYGGGEQLGGYCEVICRVLQMTNSNMGFWHKELYVMETFGCSLYQNKIGGNNEDERSNSDRREDIDR